jgi:hypothetical protein
MHYYCNDLSGCSVGITDYLEMASGPRVMTIGSGTQVILRLLPQQYERLQCWYY